jgi:nucleolar protein 58
MVVLFAALKKFLKKHAVGEELAVIDKKLGGIVQEKLGINCIYRSGPCKVDLVLVL